MEIVVKDMEIFKLEKLLKEAKVEYELENRTMIPSRPFFQIGCPQIDSINHDRYISIIQGPGTYGYEDNRLEIMGLLTEEEEKYDSVVGNLTAEEVFARIKKYLGESDGK